MEKTLDLTQNSVFLKQLLEQCYDANRQGVVDCILTNDKGEIYIQKRSSSRRLFPNLWEIPGGHIEPTDTIYETIVKEIKEELNYNVSQLTHYLGSFDFQIKPEWQKVGDNPNKRGFQFIIKADGDLRLEEGKVTDFKWVDKKSFQVLLKSEREYIDHYIEALIEKAFDIINSEKV